MILNEIEQAAVYDNMVDSTIPVGDDLALIRPIEAYMCPDDTELVSVDGQRGSQLLSQHRRVGLVHGRRRA